MGIHSSASAGDVQAMVGAYLQILRVPIVGDVEQHELVIPAHLNGPLRAVIDLRNRRGMSPLHGACYFGHEAACEWLLQRGADPNLRAGNPATRYKDMGGTALHYAAVLGHLKICYLLAYYGADLWARDTRGCLAVDIARLHGHRHCVKWLSMLMLCGSSNSRASREESHRILRQRSLDVVDRRREVLVLGGGDARPPVGAFWTPDNSGITMPLLLDDGEFKKHKRRHIKSILSALRIKA